MNYPFLDFEKLEKKFLLSREIISLKFENIVVIGFGGSTQGSKAINSFLNEKMLNFSIEKCIFEQKIFKICQKIGKQIFENLQNFED